MLDSVTTTSTTTSVATDSQSGPKASQSSIIVTAMAAILICIPICICTQSKICRGRGNQGAQGQREQRLDAESKSVDLESGTVQSGTLPNLLQRQSPTPQNKE